MRNEQQQSDGVGFAGGVGIFLFALYGYAACFTPFLRSRAGVNSPGLAGIAAMGVMWLYALFCPCPELFLFFAVWLAAVLFRRGEAVTRGQHRHSRDEGWPWLAMLMRPRPVTLFAAKGYEAAILFLAGGLLTAWSVPLGNFVMLGGVPIIVTASIERAMVNSRIRRMRDVNIDMQNYYDLYREQNRR